MRMNYEYLLYYSRGYLLSSVDYTVDILIDTHTDTNDYRLPRNCRKVQQ